MYRKKPQSNKKFDHISKTIDTGNTVKQVQILSDGYVAKRKNEMFKRIKSSVVVKLIGGDNNTESIYQLKDESNIDESYDQSKLNNAGNKENNDTQSIYSQKTDMTATTKKTSLTKKTNKTQMTSITYATEMLGNLEDLSFILLDLREKSDYDNYHIKEAISFPSANILRDKFSTEMYSFVNTIFINNIFTNRKIKKIN